MRNQLIPLLPLLFTLSACGAVTSTTATGDAGIVIGDGGVIDPTTLDDFSFFVTIMAALQELSGSANRFGGDLRFGETGDGAGLRADKLCATIAERTMQGAGHKGWRAFLSTSAVNAIDRLGSGPWYDRLGRVVASSKAELLADRPPARTWPSRTTCRTKTGCRTRRRRARRSTTTTC